MISSGQCDEPVRTRLKILEGKMDAGRKTISEGERRWEK